MTLEQRIQALATAIGVDVKTLYAKSNWQTAVLACGYPTVIYKKINVVNTSCLITSRVLVEWDNGTTADENEQEFDNMAFIITPKNGSFDVVLSHANNHFFGGNFKIKYSIIN